MKKLFLTALAALHLLTGCGAAPASAASSSGLVERLFVQDGAGAIPRQANKKLAERASVTDYGADPTGVIDSTAAFQKAITAHSDVFMPAGKYLIDPVAGIVLRTGLRLTGAGKNKTILIASPGGGTVEQLAAYQRGALLHRQFNVAPGTNAYVNDVYLADFAVVMTHPTASVTTTEIQIGIDLRNITRSIVERVHVGNIPPAGGPYVKTVSGNYEIQGYGIVIGGVSSSISSYAGGEVNTIKNCAVWGAYKLVTMDDATLSPLSSAHATVVVNSDLQTGHHLLVQEQRYAAGLGLRDNTIQNVKLQPGNVTSSYVVRAEGYGGEMTGGYIEAGPNADYLLYLGVLSKSNRFNLSYYSAKNMAAIVDAGSKNTLGYFENSGAVAGGVDSFGAPIKLFDNAYSRAWIKFHWDGAAVVVDGGQGATVVRNGIGDYTITWSRVFPSANYALSSSIDTNTSGHLGGVTVGSHTASNLRIYTSAQNAGTTTKIDPRFVWVRAEQ